MYDAETSTFDEPLEKLFQTAQYGTSPSGLGTGADLIFFVGTVQALRVIRPRIRAVTTDRLPVFTTSHVNASGFDALRDNGLVGIYFVDIPWMVSSQSLSPSLSEHRRATRLPADADRRSHAALPRQRFVCWSSSALRRAISASAASLAWSAASLA